MGYISSASDYCPVQGGKISWSYMQCPSYACKDGGFPPPMAIPPQTGSRGLVNVACGLQSRCRRGTQLKFKPFPCVNKSYCVTLRKALHVTTYVATSTQYSDHVIPWLRKWTPECSSERAYYLDKMRSPHNLPVAFSGSQWVYDAK